MNAFSLVIHLHIHGVTLMKTTCIEYIIYKRLLENRFDRIILSVLFVCLFFHKMFLQGNTHLIVRYPSRHVFLIEEITGGT